MPDLSLEEQIDNLARHHDHISIEISQHVIRLLNSHTLPLESLINSGKKLQDLQEAQALYNSLGMSMFGSKWVERNKSRILSREGKPLEKAES